MGKTLTEVALPFLQNVGSQVLKRGTSLVSGGILELDEETLKSNAEKMLEEYSDSAAKLQTVKKRLAEASERCREETGKSLVVIIDDLDRCRPLFAIELLEKIKHFFEIPGIIFVLGIDREQLGHSVRSVYGDRMNVDGYLRRFIDLEFFLKMDDSKPFFQGVFEKYAAVIENPPETDVPIKYDSGWASLVAKCFSLSLREMEYVARSVVLGSIIDRDAADYALFPILVALKLRDEEFYMRIINGKFNATTIVERLIEKHNAWLLFGFSPVTQNLMPGGTRGFYLAYELYRLSPYEWRENADSLLDQLEKISSKENLNGLPEEYFHPVIQKLLCLSNLKRTNARYEFTRNTRHRLSIDKLTKCIELIEFKTKPDE